MARRAGKPLTRPAAFWDASALVPLCVVQSFSRSIATLHDRYDVVVWWGTPVEIVSAMARLLRTREINTGDWAKARQIAAALAEEWSVIQPSNVLRAQALQIVERYDLRAADALQLAAAFEWSEGTPQGQVFLTSDQKLRDAAILSGFDGKQI